MSDFFLGVFSSLTATGFIAILINWVLPNIKDKFFYEGVRINGCWEISESRGNENVKVGNIELEQIGRCITGSSIRNKTREGKTSVRKFQYIGKIYGDQVTLVFEDLKGVGFDTGTYVFIVQNDGKTMIGQATFHGKKENRIVSEQRILTKVAS